MYVYTKFYTNIDLFPKTLEVRTYFETEERLSPPLAGHVPLVHPSWKLESHTTHPLHSSSTLLPLGALWQLGGGAIKALPWRVPTPDGQTTRPADSKT